MLAFAFHLFEAAEGEATVTVHPDGEHEKIFDIVPFLVRRGFVRTAAVGRTTYGGRYVRGAQTLIVNPTGKGDVVGEVGGRRVVAECKGGVINSTHNGQRSRTRKGMSELIGQLMYGAPRADTGKALRPGGHRNRFGAGRRGCSIRGA